MCIFCDIIDHKIPSSVVYEDDDVLAILDISQVTRGHTIVMPRKHTDNVIEADEETVSKVFTAAAKIAKRIKEKTGAAGINLLNNCGEAAGQSVNHLHVHIIPRYDGNDSITIRFGENPDTDLADVLKTING